MASSTVRRFAPDCSPDMMWVFGPVGSVSVLGVAVFGPGSSRCAKKRDPEWSRWLVIIHRVSVVKVAENSKVGSVYPPVAVVSLLAIHKGNDLMVKGPPVICSPIGGLDFVQCGVQVIGSGVLKECFWVHRVFWGDVVVGPSPRGSGSLPPSALVEVDLPVVASGNLALAIDGDLRVYDGSGPGKGSEKCAN